MKTRANTFIFNRNTESKIDEAEMVIGENSQGVSNFRMPTKEYELHYSK